MLHAVSYALLDSLNVLLVGVLFAVAVIHARTGKYARVASLLVFGDWFGVFLLSLATLLFFDWIGEPVRHFLESPIMGYTLVAVGLLSAVLSFRGGDPAPLINTLVAPLKAPNATTFTAGMVLGIIQSATSFPFFAGLGYLSVTDIPMGAKYLGVVLYASLALSLPFVFAMLIGFIQRHPESPVALLIEKMGRHKERLTAGSGYIVAAVLVFIGVLKLIDTMG
ncbi:hypothetical protein GSS87_05980 [Corynebacterium sp. 4HC-13]|uniref:Uncharacterized protein n=1 Tax=Corynebacterium anserum TaxID=2684406 RepID=A0A7G7YR63_9CORY|nr:hypothetical protein [Corynebacterium anserum]QNH96983.1 hypothetical protein GP473_06355 [Corynebacterium anserum]